jgi:hypothetical protein
MVGDLAEAIALTPETDWSVEAWTFVSNYPVSDAIGEKVNRMGTEAGLDVSWRGADYLALGLQRGRSHSARSRPRPEADRRRGDRVALNLPGGGGDRPDRARTCQRPRCPSATRTGSASRASDSMSRLCGLLAGARVRLLSGESGR